jgi:hypothetical protein
VFGRWRAEVRKSAGQTGVAREIDHPWLAHFLMATPKSRKKSPAAPKRAPKSPAPRRSAAPSVRSLGAVPDFAIAGAALLTWVNPSLLGEEKVAWFLGLMLLEFIVVHSSAFLGTVAFGSGSRAGKLGKSVGLSLCYSVFAAGFAASMRGPAFAGVATEAC